MDLFRAAVPALRGRSIVCITWVNRRCQETDSFARQRVEMQIWLGNRVEGVTRTLRVPNTSHLSHGLAILEY